jgi:anti-sigma regulatory factor (Ser/Thr protein kinase)
MHSDSGLPDGSFTVRLAVDQYFVRVEVIDQGGQLRGRRDRRADQPGDQEDASQSGRGLTIVAAIASAWGIAGDQEGRTVWCEIGTH